MVTVHASVSKVFADTLRLRYGVPVQAHCSVAGKRKCTPLLWENNFCYDVLLSDQTIWVAPLQNEMAPKRALNSKMKSRAKTIKNATNIPEQF